jgi:hypothetical protein
MTNPHPNTVELVPKGSVVWRRLRQEFLDAQDGQCAICRDPLTLDRVHLDHCHTTGFIRGALCASCNIKLGWLEGRRREIEQYLARSAEYEAYYVAARLPHGDSIRDRWRRKALEQDKARSNALMRARSNRAPTVSLAGA